MTLLNIYLAGVMLTAPVMGCIAPAKVRTRVLVGAVLLWPLTWIGAAYIYIRIQRDPESCEHMRAIRSEYEEEYDDR